VLYLYLELQATLATREFLSAHIAFQILILSLFYCAVLCSTWWNEASWL